MPDQDNHSQDIAAGLAEVNYPQIASAVFGSIWAIMPEKLQAIMEVVSARAFGSGFASLALELPLEGKRWVAPGGVDGNVAVIPLVGTIAQRMSLLTNSSGGMSTEAFSRKFQEALADDSIGAIVIDVDSPGGSVYGVQELCDRIFSARGTKPIIAAVNSLCASAAFWIASAADNIAITPGGEMGSVGVLAVHTDTSRAEDALGIKTTIIKAGPYKAEGNPHEPLSDEAMGYQQQRVDEYYRMLVDSLARNRNVSARAVTEKFGQGRVVGAKAAIEAGMADRVATLDEVVRSLKGKSQPSRHRADNRNQLTMAKVKVPAVV